MSEAVSRSRKAPTGASDGAEFVPGRTASVAVPRETLTTPPFTVQELRNCIPAHCFERSNVTSFTYLAKDVAIVTVITLIGAWLHFKANMPTWLALLVWPAYAFVQGTVLTGIWVIAHECGHRAFSPQVWVNDVVGWIFHSALLVPYFSWQFTHASHHLHTNNIGKDEVHVPYTANDSRADMPWTTTRTAISIFKHLVLGWPAYLMFNIASNKQYKAFKHVNHFSPWSPLFAEEQRPYIVLSDIGIAIMVGLLSWAGYVYGTPAVFVLYVLPYLVVNMWLVLITKLQHTNNDVPVYSNENFSWVKGQLCTVDRSYGWIFDTVLHHIQDTHVAHHLFSKMPHYHAEEATVHLKAKLGKYYRYRNDNFLRQTWDVFAECVYVAEKNGVWWYPSVEDDHEYVWNIPTEK